MGMSLANLSVKSDYDCVKDYLIKTKPSGVNLYISEGGSGYTNIFPPNETFNFVSQLAQKISQELDTLAVCGEVYDSDTVHIAFFNLGKLMFEYNLNENEKPTISGDINKLIATFQPVNFDIKKFKADLKTKETFAETKYEKIIMHFGLSYTLRETGHHYIKNCIRKYYSGSLKSYNRDPSHLKIEKI